MNDNLKRVDRYPVYNFDKYEFAINEINRHFIFGSQEEYAEAIHRLNARVMYNCGLVVFLLYLLFHTTRCNKLMAAVPVLRPDVNNDGDDDSRIPLPFSSCFRLMPEEIGFLPLILRRIFRPYHCNAYIHLCQRHSRWWP